MPDRYDIREEPDGSWAVFDVATGATVIVNGEPQTGLDIQDADDIADSLTAVARMTDGRGTRVRQ